jgi:hypothetical protein
MARLDFFATQSDLEQVFAYLYGETDFRVYELASEFGQELREFPSWRALNQHFDVGQDQHGNGHAVLLQLWSPSISAKLDVVRTALNPDACNGHTFRFTCYGIGLIALYLGGIKDRVVTPTHFGHYSKIGAARYGDPSTVDWPMHTKLAGRVQRHIRKLAMAKAAGTRVLPDAFRLHEAGYELKSTVQAPWSYKVEPLETK